MTITIHITQRQQDALGALDREGLAVYHRNRQAYAGHAEALRIAFDDMALRRFRRLRAAREERARAHA